MKIGVLFGLIALSLVLSVSGRFEELDHSLVIWLCIALVLVVTALLGGAVITSLFVALLLMYNYSV